MDDKTSLPPIAGAAAVSSQLVSMPGTTVVLSIFSSCFTFGPFTFGAEGFTPADGAREIYEALKFGRVDTGIKTVTVKWYQHIMDAKQLVNSLAMDGRLL